MLGCQLVVSHTYVLSLRYNQVQKKLGTLKQREYIKIKIL